jgi:hypothetical protein
VPVTLKFTAGIRSETFRLTLEVPDSDVISDNELVFQLDI